MIHKFDRVGVVLYFILCKFITHLLVTIITFTFKKLDKLW